MREPRDFKRSSNARVLQRLALLDEAAGVLELQREGAGVIDAEPYRGAAPSARPGPARPTRTQSA